MQCVYYLWKRGRGCSLHSGVKNRGIHWRWSQAVHGFILDGKSFKACFGTTKYCHAWLRNVACIVFICTRLVLLRIVSQKMRSYQPIQEFNKSLEQHIFCSPVQGACYLHHLMLIAVTVLLQKFIQLVQQVFPGVLLLLGAEALADPLLFLLQRHGGHIMQTSQSLASSVTSNGPLAFSAVVANAARPVSSSDVLKRPSSKEESQTVVDKSKLSVLKPLHHHVVVNSRSKRTSSPNRDPISSQLSSSLDSSYDSRDIDKPSATVNSFDEAVDDGPTISNLSVGVARMGITTNSWEECPDITVAIGSQCDQGSIRQPGHEVSELPLVEQCRMDSSINTDKKDMPSESGFPRSRPEWVPPLKARVGLEIRFAIADAS